MRNGFTLIELLLVVVIIGIVAALVLPKFGDVKQKAYVTAMKSDLRNLAVAEEIYQDANGSYALNSAYSAAPFAGVTTSDNVSIKIETDGSNGYVATARHAKVDSTKTCSIAIGTASSSTQKVTCL